MRIQRRFILTIEPTDDTALKVLREEGLSRASNLDIDGLVFLSRVGGSCFPSFSYYI